MIKIAPTSKAKDVGAKDGGEDWQQKMNIIVLKETTDFIINSDNVVLQWNQDLEIGKDGSQGTMTVDISYTNTQVGNLTDADFLTDVTADCTGICHMSEWELSLMDAGLAFPAVEDEVSGFDDKCEVPAGAGINWGAGCRMQELCGTGCASGECKWHWDTSLSQTEDDATCACAKCETADFLQ